MGQSKKLLLKIYIPKYFYLYLLEYTYIFTQQIGFTAPIFEEDAAINDGYYMNTVTLSLLVSLGCLCMDTLKHDCLILDSNISSFVLRNKRLTEDFQIANPVQSKLIVMQVLHDKHFITIIITNPKSIMEVS
jgi:hypothetical protein